MRKPKTNGGAVVIVRRPVIPIRKLPSVNATQRAMTTAYSDQCRHSRSLRYAFAVLSVIIMENDWGRIPPGWAGGGRAFKKGYVLYNARTALERLRTRLEPLDFDVDYSITG